MIDKLKLQEFVENALANTDCYLTDLTVSADNDIVVEIDSSGMIDIDFCSALSRRIEEAFSRDEEDYTLEVGSAGLTSPFKVRQQWENNVGNDIAREGAQAALGGQPGPRGEGSGLDGPGDVAVELVVQRRASGEHREREGIGLG